VTNREDEYDVDIQVPVEMVQEDISTQERELQTTSDQETPAPLKEIEAEPVPILQEEVDSDPLDIDLGDGYQVDRVVDGDTVRVFVGGVSESIRIIGLDTPESVDPRKPVECFGLEASNKAQELLQGKVVELEMDPTQGDRDRFGRLLRYVILPDGRNFSQVMIEEGYGFEYTFIKPHRYQEDFKEAQRQAREQQRGLWNPTVCSEYQQQPQAVPSDANGMIKQSSSGICHSPESAWYDRTTNFTPYETIEACLESGGRLPQ
jgi:micrococcal nuclease